MPTFWEIDVDSKGRGVELAWREESKQDWTVIGEKTAKRFRIAVPSSGRFLLRARPTDRNGKVLADEQKILTLEGGGPVTDRPDPADLTVPEPEVAQDGAAFFITQRAPLGQRQEEYLWECRHSLSGVDPEDAKQVGIFDVGDSTREDSWSGVGEQEIHVRIIRKADGVCGPWFSTALTPKDATEADTQDHSTGFASGTILPIGDVDVEPLEIASGNLRMRSDVALDDFANTALDDLAETTLDMMGGTPSLGRYRTPTVVLPETQAFAVEFCPVTGTITRPSLSLDDLAVEPLGPPELDDDDEPLDNEVDRMSATLEGTEEPVRAELKVATSASDSPTWSDADFKPHVPGKVHVCRSVAYEVTLRSLRGVVVEFSSLRIRRETVCRRCDARLVHVLREQTGHAIPRGKVVYLDGSGDVALAKADAVGTLAVGIVSLVPDANHLFVATSGIMRWPSHGLTLGTRYYLSPVTAGALTSTRPSGGEFIQSIVVPITSDELFIQIGQGEETA